MSNDDFLSMVGDDVVPKKTAARVSLRKDPILFDKAPRRLAASALSQSDLDPLSSAPVEMLNPLDELAFMRPGVQHGVYKNLRLGKYTTDARLDLHRMTVEQARLAVYQFVQDCLAHDVRAAIITHGKGIGREQPALLKSCVAHWLPQMDEILAFHSAQKQHGGVGATYILIKKSAQKKRQTRLQNT